MSHEGGNTYNLKESFRKRLDFSRIHSETFGIKNLLFNSKNTLILLYNSKFLNQKTLKPQSNMYLCISKIKRK